MAKLGSLKTRKDFSQFLNCGKKKTVHFVAMYIPIASLSENQKKLQRKKLDDEKCSSLTRIEKTRLAVVIPKRNVKKSVSRNLIKRWIRALLKDSDLLIDIIVKVNRPLKLNSKVERLKVLNELKLLLSFITDGSQI